MSHGDGVEAIPPGFEPVASTPSALFAAIEDRRRRYFAVQFHPEVVHTPQGKDLLWNFAHHVCGCAGTWSMRAFMPARTRFSSRISEANCRPPGPGGHPGPPAATVTRPAHRAVLGATRAGHAQGTAQLG